MSNNSPYGKIPNGWKLLPLKEVCIEEGGIQTGPFGSQLHQKDYVEDGIPIITVEHLGENRIIHENLPKVTEEDRERLKRYSIKEGDIVFSRVGSVDRRALVRKGEDGWLFSGRCLRVRPDTNKVNPSYLSWFFGLPSFTNYVRRIAVGATMPSLNTQLLSNLPVFIPPLEEQKRISNILDPIDSKIELNRRMNQTLEEIARTLFQSWFVNFDPVRAKAEGRDPGLPAEVAGLFPNTFEESELGEIPRGWRIETINSDFNLIMGQSPPGETYNENGVGLPFYQGRKDFTFRYPKRRVYCTKPTRLANYGDTLVSVRAPVGDTNMAIEKCAIGRGVAAIRHKSNSRSFTYYYMKFLNNEFKKFEAEGTVFGSINKDDFSSMKVISPPPEIVRQFDYFCSPLDGRIETNENETNNLILIRDLLLPRLLSGEITTDRI